MKTEELITSLSLDAPQKKRWGPAAILVFCAALSILVTVVTSFTWLHPRVDWLSAINTDYVMQAKIIFAIAVVLAAIPIVRDATIPGRSVVSFAVFALVPFLIMLLLAVYEASALSANDRHQLMTDSLWISCLWKVPVLALPAFFILSFAARQLAPTNLVMTGAFIGLLAGGIGALGYAFHCHDDSVIFVAIAYSLAIFETVLLGVLLGPILLRWK